MDIEKALDIGGWMTEPELKWLAKQARRHINIVEIGSFIGRSTRALADNTNGVVFAVDDFKGPRDTEASGDFLQAFLTNLQDHIEELRVIPVLADHGEVVIAFKPDMVFIDGSHEYLDVKRDIELWRPKLAPGGLICGHDYTNMAGVKEAVEELFKRPKLVKGTSIWYAKA